MLLCIRFLVYFVDDKASSVQLQAKQAAFLSNAAMVEAHNRDASQSYKMELNRFSDWTKVSYLLSLKINSSALPDPHCVTVKTVHQPTH